MEAHLSLCTMYSSESSLLAPLLPAVHSGRRLFARASLHLIRRSDDYAARLTFRLSDKFGFVRSATAEASVAVKCSDDGVLRMRCEVAMHYFTLVFGLEEVAVSLFPVVALTPLHRCKWSQ